MVHGWSSAGLGPACPELSILRWSPPEKAPRDTLRHPGALSIGDRDAHSLDLPRQEPLSLKDPVPPCLQGLPPLPDSSWQLHLDLQMWVPGTDCDGVVFTDLHRPLGIRARCLLGTSPCGRSFSAHFPGPCHLTCPARLSGWYHEPQSR